MATTSRTCTHRLATPRSRATLAALVLLFASVLPAAAQLDDGYQAAAEATAGPFDTAARFGFSGNTWYAQIPHHPDLNPPEFTFEAWVFLVGPENCGSIAGKGYFTSWWIGFCGFGLRSYLIPAAGALDGGAVPVGSWHHVALTYDGVTRRHYVDGVLTASRAEAGPIGTNTNPLRFGSDVNWTVTPDARIDEARVWKRALTAFEIQEVLQIAIRGPRPGLVAVWSFDDISSCTNFVKDELGNHNGTCVNTPSFFTETGGAIVLAPDAPAGPWLSTDEIPDFEFKVRITSDVVRLGTEVENCVPDTLCVAGAIPSRTEIALRVIGPRPNGFLWAQGSRFTVSLVEVWIRRESTGQINYYILPPLPADASEIGGFNDSVAFVP